MFSTALPETVGPYRLESLLGSGGMGRVYLAYDARLDRRVAIKHIRPERAGQSESRERLRREARAAAGLSHPSIVPVFDLLTTDAGDWVVMEYVDGPTLAEWIAAGPPPLRSMVEIALQVIAGLRYAHAEGIVHRDLKTENVMLSRQGGARILDFGLAKRMGDHGELDLTTDGEVLGTLRSMSPEQAQGGEITPASDLFSFGVLLYECFAGVSPFESRSTIDSLVRLCTEPHEPLATAAPHLPEALTDLVDHLLAKEPAERPNGAEIEATLRRVLDRLGEPSSPTLPATELISTRPTPSTSGTVEETVSLAPPTAGTDRGSRSETWPWTSRRWLIPSALGLLLLGVLALTGWLVARGWGTSDEPGLRGRDAYAEALRLLETGYHLEDARRAEELLGKTLEVSPNHAPSHAALARALLWRYSHTDDRLLLDRAFDEASRAVELDPYLASARVELAVMHRSRGKNDAARRELDRALELDPANPLALRELASLRCYLEGPAAAEAAFDRALEIAPEDWLLHERIGLCYWSAGDFDAAETAFRRVVELEPNYPLAYSNLMAIEYTNGHLTEAAAWIQKALEIQPSATAYSNLGTLEFFQGRYRTAREAYERAIELGARSPINWANLADALRWLPGEEPKADELYRRAIQLTEEDLISAPSHRVSILESRLTNYLAKSGEVEAALAHIPAEPSNQTLDPHSLYRFAQALEILQRRERALRFLEAALDAGYPANLVERDPEMTELRGDPDYQLLRARYES